MLSSVETDCCILWDVSEALKHSQWDILKCFKTYNPNVEQTFTRFKQWLRVDGDEQQVELILHHRRYTVDYWSVIIVGKDDNTDNKCSQKTFL